MLIISVFAVSCNQEEKHEHHHGLDPNSIAAIKMEIQKHPDSLMLKEDLIEAYRNRGDYDSALAIADEEIRKDSGSAYLWNIKATLYFENDDTANTIASLKHAIDIYPLPDYLIALATVYAETRNDSALSIAGDLLASNKTKYGKDAYFIKGLFYNYSLQPQKAIPALNSCLNMDFAYMYAYREKAIALYQMNKYQAALDVLKRAVTIQNNFDEGYYWMGKCYEKLGKNDEAVESYQRALLYDKNYVEAREALERLKK